MKTTTTPTFRTPEFLKWTFLSLVLLPIAMMARNAFVLVETEKETLSDENVVLTEEVFNLKETNLVLGRRVEGLSGELAESRLENNRLVAAKAELSEEISAVRVQIGYHESREDSLQRVIDLLKNEIVANERKVASLKSENRVAVEAFRRIGGAELESVGTGATAELAEQNYFGLVKANEKLAQQMEANDRQALDLLSEISELNTELEGYKSSQSGLKEKVVSLNQELLEKRALIDAIAMREAD